MLQLKKLYDENWKFFAWVLAATIAILLLFNGNCSKVDKPVIIPVTDQVKTVDRVEDKINLAIDSIILETGNIQKSIAPVQVALKKSQAKTKAIVDVVKETPATVNDSSDYFNWKNAVNIGESATKSDSLANIIIDSLNKVISNKDKIIKLKTDLNDSLKLAFEISIDQQKLLTAYSKKLERKVKWTQAGKWGWKAAAVAGGLFILKSTIK